MWVQVLFLIPGCGYLGKSCIPDSVLFVHSKISTISSNNYAYNKNGFRQIISTLPAIKMPPQGVGSPNSKSHEFPCHIGLALTTPLIQGRD